MDEQDQHAIRFWTQPVVSAYLAEVVRGFRDRDAAQRWQERGKGMDKK